MVCIFGCDQEFVYVGDEAWVVEGMKTERMGIDITARYEIYQNWFADFNLSIKETEKFKCSR